MNMDELWHQNKTLKSLQDNLYDIVILARNEEVPYSAIIGVVELLKIRLANEILKEEDEHE